MLQNNELIKINFKNDIPDNVDPTKLLNFIEDSARNALVPPAPNMAEEAKDILLAMKLGWYFFEDNARVDIERLYELFHQNIFLCNPSLDPILNYDSSIDLVNLRPKEISRMKTLGSIYLSEKNDSKSNHIKNLKTVRHPITKKARYFKGILYQNKSPLFFENSFARVIPNWPEVSIVSTANAVELLDIINAKDVITSISDKVISYIKSCYKEGVFTSEDEEIDAYNYHSTLIYDTRSVIVILKSLYHIKCEDVLGKTRAIDIIKNKEVYENIFIWAKKRLDDILDEFKSRKGNYTIIDLYVTLWILWQLTGRVTDVPNLIENGRKRIKHFLKSCLTIREGYQIPALIPGTETPCLAACRFFSLIIDKYLNPSEYKDVQKGIKHNLETCKHTGGYGGIDSKEPDLLHTYLGLNLLKNEDQEYNLDEQFEQKIISFLDSCCHQGGYSLIPTMQPSAHGTRLACQIYEKFLGKKYPYLPNPEETKQFIKALWDEDKCGFRGIVI